MKPWCDVPLYPGSRVPVIEPQADLEQVPYCLGCSYRLTGVNNFRCPECGRAFDPDDPASYRKVPDHGKEPGEKGPEVSVNINVGWLFLIGLAIILVIVLSRGKPPATAPGAPAPEDGGVSLFTIVLVGIGVLIGGFFGLWWLCGRWLTARQDRVRVLCEEQSYEEALSLLKRTQSSWHPGAFLMRLWCPGYMEIVIAQHLNDLDRPDEAMEWIEKSDRANRKRPKARRLIQRNVAILLRAMHQYDSERLAEACAFDESATNDRKLDIRVWLTLDRGRLDEAVGLCEREFNLASKAEQDVVRYSLSAALEHLGRFEQALGVLGVAPSGVLDIDKKPNRSGSSALMPAETDSSIEHRNRFKLNVRILYKQREIDVCHEAGLLDRAAEANEVLDRIMDRNMATLASMAGFRATDAALRGDAQTCDKWLAEYVKCEQLVPWRSNQADVALRRGRCHFRLGRIEQARGDLSRVLELSAVPMLRHVARFWLARAHEAAGDMETARREYERVVADGTNSWMEKEATAGVTRCT